MKGMPAYCIRIGLLFLCLSSPAMAVDNVGLFQPSNKTILLKNTLTGGAADEQFQLQAAGTSGQIFPVGGNFETDELHGVGMYDRATQIFHLRHAHATGSADQSFIFSPTGSGTGMYPLAGDWDGNGVETIGLFHQPTGTFYLRNSNSSGGASITMVITGVTGIDWLPLVGDWNGDGIDSVGAFSLSTRSFRLRNTSSSGSSQVTFTFESLPSGTYLPIAGDWNSDGFSTVGVYNQAISRFHLKNSLTTGGEDLSFAFGLPSGYLPITGNWDGDAFRFKVPPGPNGEAILGFSQLVKSPAQAAGQFELYFPAADSFSDSSQQKLMYNIWDGSAWLYNPSRILYDHVPDASTAFGSVFINSNPVFIDPQGAAYKRLMYYVYQPNGSAAAGWVCLAFSNDGLTWTAPIKATTNPSSQVSTCAGDGGIATEAVSGFLRGTTLWMAVMEGTLGTLIDGINNEVTNTFTYLYSADRANPRVMTKLGEFSQQGILRPNKGGRFLHGYGINVDFTFNPTEPALYFSRAYPYSYDKNGGIPCNNPPATPRCVTGVTQLPNRAQIYKMVIPLGRIRDALTGSWQLVEDYGASVGYRDTDSGSCQNGGLESKHQTSLGLDINSVSFYKDHGGRIDSAVLGGRYVVFGAGPKDRVYANCDFTVRHLYVLPVGF